MGRGREDLCGESSLILKYSEFFFFFLFTSVNTGLRTTKKDYNWKRKEEVINWALGIDFSYCEY